MTGTTETPAAGAAARLRRLARGGALAGAAAALLFTAACASGAPPGTPVDSVGRLAGSAGLVAVVSSGDDVTAYVCDGPGGLGERFRGHLDGDVAELRSPGGATLALRVAGDGATGTFTPAGGSPQAFTTTASTGDAGFYTAAGKTADGTFAAGWVVLPDGTQTGSARAGGKRLVAGKIRFRHRDHNGHNGGIVPPTTTVELPAEIEPGPVGGPGRQPADEDGGPVLTAAPDPTPTKEVADGPVRGGGGAGGVLTAAPDPTPTKVAEAGPVGGRTAVDDVEAESEVDGVGAVRPVRVAAGS
jgi:hypothetical protein